VETQTPAETGRGFHGCLWRKLSDFKISGQLRHATLSDEFFPHQAKNSKNFSLFGEIRIWSALHPKPGNRKARARRAISWASAVRKIPKGVTWR
jgi:hypothetical protein